MVEKKGLIWSYGLYYIGKLPYKDRASEAGLCKSDLELLSTNLKAKFMIQLTMDVMTLDICIWQVLLYAS